MKPFRTCICETNADFARSLIFILETRRTADPALLTADAYTIMLRLLRYGTSIRFEDESGAMIGFVGYTMGTPYQEYEDGDVAYIEYCLAPIMLHGTLFFMKCLGVLAETIKQRNPEAVWFALAARTDHRLNNRLYSKFARLADRIEGERGDMNIYAAPLGDVLQYVAKFN